MTWLPTLSGADCSCHSPAHAYGPPNSLTVHGFGLGGDGELYAMVTNTAANGTGGIVYKLVAAAIPEPASGALFAVARNVTFRDLPIIDGSAVTRSRNVKCAVSDTISVA